MLLSERKHKRENKCKPSWPWLMRSKNASNKNKTSPQWLHLDCVPSKVNEKKNKNKNTGGGETEALYLLEMEERRPLAIKRHDLWDVVICLVDVDAGAVWDDIEV